MQGCAPGGRMGRQRPPRGPPCPKWEQKGGPAPAARPSRGDREAGPRAAGGGLGQGWGALGDGPRPPARPPGPGRCSPSRGARRPRGPRIPGLPGRPLPGRGGLLSPSPTTPEEEGGEGEPAPLAPRHCPAQPARRPRPRPR
ncbi:PREDICTED: basic proline-rich protein-like, partial [Chinchilla lanigera]|uniref:basic proline-rich protein-like n=1 Tax=Chinchilla lanigera TaxID=34839 RepID=UPI00069708E7